MRVQSAPRSRPGIPLALAVCALAPPPPAWAQAEVRTGAGQAAAADLAQQLANPVANLISVPFQSNLDYGGGRGGAFRYTLNVQPVVPLTLNDDWNLITRTILPFSHVERVFPDHRSGLGDVVQSFFFSPARPSPASPGASGPSSSIPRRRRRAWACGSGARGRRVWCCSSAAAGFTASSPTTSGAWAARARAARR